VVGAPEERGRSEVQGPRPLTDHPAYDELAVRRRLSLLDRHRKTLFATLCAQYLWPQYEQHATTVGQNPATLAPVLDRLWAALAGEPVDLTCDLPLVGEQLLDEDSPEWIFESASVDDAVACLVYAIETWLTDDPENAAWAVRRLYDSADHAVRAALYGRSPGLSAATAGSLELAEAEARELAHPIAQTALGFIASALEAAETSPSTAWPALRERVGREARVWE
jgi:hypothetical protein